MSRKPSDESYSEAEAARRRDAIVRNMIATPPTPHAIPKGKRTTSRATPAPKKRKKSTDSA